ncbi:TPA: hypothetical protein EYN23_10995, partial [Candidatus Poribacteria bacterium]|nr:hypothetical protein [Candidatus Poribacteria bacterium]
MKRSVTAVLAVVLGSTQVLVGQVVDAPSVDASESHSPNSLEIEAATLNGVVQTYCQVCHNDAMMTGNLSLAGFEVENAPNNPETAENMIRKLRAGMMPPPGMPRPSP